MSTQDLSAFTPEVWSKRILRNLDRINVMLGLVSRDYEGDIKDQGSTVQVRTFGSVTMSAYSRGGTINYGALAPVKESLQINDAQNFAFSVDDLDEAQMDINALDGYSMRAAVAVNNKVEDKCLSFYSKAPAANRITNGGAAIAIASNNAYGYIVDAGTALTKQNAPKNGRWMVITPDFAGMLRKDTTNFIRATDLGDEVVQTGRLSRAAKDTPGFIGRIGNFDVYESNAVPSDASGFYNQFGAGPVINYAGQIRKVETIRRETTWATAVRGLLLHDGTVFNESAKGFGYILTDK